MNAIQAMCINGEIYINILEEPNDVVLITFKDTDHGIPSILIPKIFDLLFTNRQIGIG